MQKIQMVEFNSQVPNPSKGVQARSHFNQAYAFEEGTLEIYREGDTVFLIAPKAGRKFGTTWSNVKFVEYGQETCGEDSSRSSEAAGEKNEPGPGRNSVRSSKGVRSRQK